MSKARAKVYSFVASARTATRLAFFASRKPAAKSRMGKARVERAKVAGCIITSYMMKPLTD